MRIRTVAVRIPLLGALFCLALLSVPLRAQVANPHAVVIDGGTLIDGTGKAPVPGVAILVERGRIRQIGKQGELKAPAGAQVLDARGKFIIPGLIDSHVHYNSPWLHKLYLAKGVTSVRDLGNPMDRIVTLRDEIAAGNILAPRMFISGNPGNWKRAGFPDIKAMTKSLIEYGLDGIKVTGYTLQELKDTIEVAHANGLIVYGHTGPRMNGKGVGNTGWGSDVGALRAVEAGLDGVEHVIEFLEDCVDQDIPMPADFDPMRRDMNMIHYYGKLANAVSPARVDHLIQVMVQKGAYLSPTLTVYDRVFAKRNLPEISSDPALKYMPEDKPDRWGKYGEEERKGWQASLKAMREATYKFWKAGGLLIAGTDSQAAAPDGAHPGWSLHQEIENYVNAGVPPMAALQSATLSNAKVLNRLKDLGTVETGKLADILVLDADPLQDIRNTQKIHRVVLNGVVLDPAVLLEDHLRQFGERGKKGKTSTAPGSKGFTNRIPE